MTDGLLLLHAWPLDASMWEPQVGALGDVAVVAPDLPGFGSAPLRGDVTTMDACAEAALEALDAAGLRRAVLCGLSMGGYVAFALWRRHRERVAGLVLANTRAVADDPAGRERRLTLAERLRREGSAFLIESPPPLLGPNAPGPLRERVRAIVAAQPAEAIAAASVGMAERPDSTPDLGTIDVPALVISSTADELIPVDVSRAMADGIPEAGFETIEGVGHLSNLEAPDEFSRLVREHLEACRAGERRTGGGPAGGPVAG